MSDTKPEKDPLSIFGASSGLQIRAKSAQWWQKIEFMLCERRGNDCYVATDIFVEPHKPFEEVKPSFGLDPDAAQTLMDDLWQCGIRPRDNTESPGALTATQKHLEDMRTLVFKENAP